MDKYALITGASNGIGYELAKIMASKGHNLILVARNVDKMKVLQNELANCNVKIEIIGKDLSIQGAGTELYSEIKDKNLVVNVLINNAGFADYGSFAQTKWEKERQMLNLNIVALTELTKLYFSDMVTAKTGRILNVASTAAFEPGPLMAVYFAAKAYVLSLSEALANEAKGTGVTVTALCPGPTKTGFEEAANLGESKLFKSFPAATAQSVAQYAYKSMMKGKAVAVHGFSNKLMVFTIRFTPRKTVAALVRMLTEKK